MVSYILAFLLVLGACVGLFVAVRRRHWILGLGSVALGVGGALLATSGGPSFFGPSRAEQEQAQAHQEQAQAQRERELAEQQRAKKAAAVASEQKRRADVHTAMVADFAKLTPAERAKKMRAACDPNGPLRVCDQETVLALVQAAASEDEKRQLRLLAGQLLDAFK